MNVVYVIEGWEQNAPRIRKDGPGITKDPVFVRADSDLEPLPTFSSRADVYRWLASLEDRGVEIQFSAR